MTPSCPMPTDCQPSRPLPAPTETDTQTEAPPPRPHGADATTEVGPGRQLGDFQRFRVLLDISHDAIFLLRAPDGAIVDVNQTACQQMNRAPEDLLGQPLIPHLGTDAAACLQTCLEREANGNQREFRLGSVLRARDGTAHPVDLAVIRHDLDGGRYLCVVARDLTEQNRREVKLRQSQAWYRVFIENFSAAAYQLNAADGTLNFLHGRFSRITGYATSELLEGRVRWHDLIHPDDQARLQAAGERLRTQADHQEDHEYRIIHRDGRIRWVQDIAVNVSDETGAPVLVQGVMHDITDRREAQESLAATERRLREIVEHSTNLFYVHTPEHVLTYVSPQSRKLLGWEPEEVKSRWPEFLTANPANAIARERTQRALETGQSQPPSEIELLHRNGQPVWVEVNEAPVVQAGRVVAMAGSFTDITARKHAEAERNRLFNLSLDLCCVAGFDGRFQQLNPAWQRTLGWTETEMTSRPWLEFVHPEDVSATLEAGRRLLAGQPVTGFENRYRCRDGSYRWLAWNSFPLPEEELMFAIVRDVTESKRAQDVLRLDEQRLEALLKLDQMREAPMSELVAFAMEEAVRLTGSRLGYVAFVSADETVMTMHAWSRDAMKECNVADALWVYPVAGTGLWGEAIRQRRSVVTNDYAAPNPLKKGTPTGHVPLQRHMNVPIFDGDRIVVVAGVGNKSEDYNETDVRQLTLLMSGMWRIVQRKTAEEEVHRLNAELEVRVIQRTADLAAANKELESFCYSVSHDLRGPLRAIHGFSRVVLDEHGETLGEQGRQDLGRVCAASQRLSLLIDDLLKLSRFTRGELRQETVNLSEIATEILVRLQASQPERAVTTLIAPGLKAKADPTLIRAVLENLLGNAWKYSGKRPQARIEVGCASRPGSHKAFFVRDNGAGFDMRFSGKLFGAFQRLHSQEDFEGNGIGLATVQRIIHRHGGRVWAEGAVGEGATFYFTVTTPKDPAGTNA